jgi:hypothetical protein
MRLRLLGVLGSVISPEVERERFTCTVDGLPSRVKSQSFCNFLQEGFSFTGSWRSPPSSKSLIFGYLRVVLPPAISSLVGEP